MSSRDKKAKKTPLIILAIALPLLLILLFWNKIPGTQKEYNPISALFYSSLPKTDNAYQVNRQVCAAFKATSCAPQEKTRFSLLSISPTMRPNPPLHHAPKIHANENFCLLINRRTHYLISDDGSVRHLPELENTFVVFHQGLMFAIRSHADDGNMHIMQFDPETNKSQTILIIPEFPSGIRQVHNGKFYCHLPDNSLFVVDIIKMKTYKTEPVIQADDVVPIIRPDHYFYQDDENKLWMKNIFNSKPPIMLDVVMSHSILDVIGDIAFVASRDNFVMAFDIHSGKLLAKYPVQATQDAVISDFKIHQGLLYVLNFKEKVTSRATYEIQIFDLLSTKCLHTIPISSTGTFRIHNQKILYIDFDSTNLMEVDLSGIFNCARE